MQENSWDPLLESRAADQDIVASAQKREIKNILKSYVGMYDSFSELIQNALDAVDKRLQENDTNYKRKLWLEINLKENSFTIVDNGVGFNQAEFRSFLAPNISFKVAGDTRGNKGVGSTYIAYGFDYLQFGTKGNGHQFIGELKGGRQWTEDTNGIVTRPVVINSNSDNLVFESIDRGSIFKIKFGGEQTRPKDLSWFSASTAEQWMYLLLIKTPLGAINNQKTEEDCVQFDLKVIDKLDNITTISDKEAKFIYPHTKIKASINLKYVLDDQKKLVEASKDASQIPSKYKQSNGIYEFFNSEEIKNLRKYEDEEKALIDKFNINAYGYFTYSTSVWDQFNDKLAKLRKGYRVLKGGLQLANNSMIQGELIAIPLTSNIGYQNQCFIIVHFKNADPDLGRKGFQPELKDLAETIAVSIVNRFKKWKRLLKADSGATPDIIRNIELNDWIRNQENYEIEHPLVLSNENFFKPVNEISIVSEPQSEQDVIVLFNQLIAGGVIRGIKLLSTSQIKQYDGIFKFYVKEPVENYVFDKITNPLGVIESNCGEEFTTEPKILEYKFNLDALIHEFETEYKKPIDISLAIAWEMGSEWKKNYEAISFLNLDYQHQRQFHGITHVLNSTTTSFTVIILKELVDYLNNVDGVQAYQKETYENDLFK